MGVGLCIYYVRYTYTYIYCGRGGVEVCSVPCSLRVAGSILPQKAAA